MVGLYGGYMSTSNMVYCQHCCNLHNVLQEDCDINDLKCQVYQKEIKDTQNCYKTTGSITYYNHCDNIPF